MKQPDLFASTTKRNNVACSCGAPLVFDGECQHVRMYGHHFGETPAVIEPQEVILPSGARVGIDFFRAAKAGLITDDVIDAAVDRFMGALDVERIDGDT